MRISVKSEQERKKEKRKAVFESEADNESQLPVVQKARRCLHIKGVISDVLKKRYYYKYGEVFCTVHNY